jgi:hypothetical protein
VSHGTAVILMLVLEIQQNMGARGLLANPITVPYSIVDLLADRYDGSVMLADTGPEGSVFTVDLPRADVESAAPKTGGESATTIGGR